MTTLPLDPQLPPDFESTPHEARPEGQIRQWWDKPYLVSRPDAGGYDAYCLNGGAWDGPSWLASGNTPEEVSDRAVKQQAEWVKTRLRPVMRFDGGKVHVVRKAQNPLDDDEILATADSAEEAARLIQQFSEQAPPEN